jgi:hypothetical protein
MVLAIKVKRSDCGRNGGLSFNNDMQISGKFLKRHFKAYGNC